MIVTSWMSFERLAAAFVLASVDAGVELLEDLIVAGEESSIEYFRVAEVYGRLERMGGDDDALLLGRELEELEVELRRSACRFRQRCFETEIARRSWRLQRRFRDAG